MPHEETSPLYKANTLVAAGVMLMQDKRFDKAFSCFDEALGYTADLWYFKGAALHEMKKYKDALKCYKTALELNPKHSGSRMGKGVAMHHMYQYRPALAIYNAIIADGGNVALAWFNKACAYCMMGKDVETFDCLRKAHELDSFKTSIHIDKEESFDRIRDTVEFIKLVEELREHAEDVEPVKQDMNCIG